LSVSLLACFQVVSNNEKEKANQTCDDQEQMFVTALSANDHVRNDWIINSGVTQHMTFEREWFTTYESIYPRKVYMGDDTILEAIGKGNINATMQVRGKMLLQPSHKFFIFPK